MKIVGDVLFYVGLLLVVVAGPWLNEVFPWWSTVATACLIGLGTAITVIGVVVSKRGRRDVKDTGPKPPIT